MEKVKLKYSDLKDSIDQLLLFTNKRLGIEELDMNSCIREDLRFQDLDGYEYLDQFQNHFNCILPDSVYNYVSDPVSKLNFFQKIMHLILMVCFPLSLLICRILSNKKEESILQKKKRNKNELTLGDLAISASLGRFVKRQILEIELIF